MRAKMTDNVKKMYFTEISKSEMLKKLKDIYLNDNNKNVGIVLKTVKDGIMFLDELKNSMQNLEKDQKIIWHRKTIYNRKNNVKIIIGNPKPEYGDILEGYLMNYLIADNNIYNVNIRNILDCQDTLAYVENFMIKDS